MAEFFIFFIVILTVVGIASGIWRVNMMINDPEKYKKFREAEREHQERQIELMKRAGSVGAKGGLFLAKLFFKK